MDDYRSDFPIFKTHPDLVYLDSAATSQKPQQVIDAVVEYYSSYSANAHRGIYPIAEKTTEAVEGVRKKVQKFINARFPEEIIFVKNTTEAINFVASTFGEQVVVQGDSIAVPISEHHSNFVPWQQLAKRQNARFEVIDIDKNCQLSIPTFQFQNVRMLTFSHVSNVLGTINPVSEIVLHVKSNSAKNKQALDTSSFSSNNDSSYVFIDAAQSAPHMNIDVQKMGCDFLAFSGHKMLAETGIGVLYIRKELHGSVPPFLFGGHMIEKVTIDHATFAHSPSQYEAGTLNIAGIISLGAAIDYLKSIGLEKIQRYENYLAQVCIKQLEKIEGVTIYGPKNIEQRSGIVSFTIDGIHPHDIAQVLGDTNICIRAGHHCAMPLHAKLGIIASARVSFYIYNTEEDVKKLIQGIKKAKKIFRIEHEK